MQKKSFWDNPHVKNKREFSLILVEFLILIFCFYNLSFAGRIFPNVYVAGINLGGKTPNQVIEMLSKISVPEKVILTYQDKTFDVTKDSIAESANLSESANAAFLVYRTGNIFLDFGERIASLFNKKELGLRITKDETKLASQISVIAGQVEKDPIPPSLGAEGGKAVFNKGSIGNILDRELLKAEIGSAFSLARNENIEIPLKVVDPTLSDNDAARFQARGNTLVTKKLTLTYGDQNFIYKDQDIINFIDPLGTYTQSQIQNAVKDISTKLNHNSVNSVFVFDGGKVKEFKPSQDGVTVREDLLKQMIEGNLRTLEETDAMAASITIPITLTPPEIKTGDINNLGIKELIGRGVSFFAGSIPGRIFNIDLASSKFNGVLVAPGKVFSFNDIVGDISKETGYKPAYIISEGKTILGDGGGVCQVSTTLFRAALNAGLPILERTAHAYRVGYYEQNAAPGLDATVYGPTVDLKIKNDTDNYILIQTEVDNQNVMLAFDIYGTKDGRVSKISTPILTNQIPPPPDVYQDDPTLPSGKIVQTEHKAWGGTATFNYVVTRGGNITFSKTFISNYQAWAAVYLRDTGVTQ